MFTQWRPKPARRYNATAPTNHLALQEDSQPNESINKRSQVVPPQIRSTGHVGLSGGFSPGQRSSSRRGSTLRSLGSMSRGGDHGQGSGTLRAHLPPKPKARTGPSNTMRRPSMTKPRPPNVIPQQPERNPPASSRPADVPTLPRPVKRRKVDAPSSPGPSSNNSSPSMRRTASIGAIPHLMMPIASHMSPSAASSIADFSTSQSLNALAAAVTTPSGSTGPSNLSNSPTVMASSPSIAPSPDASFRTYVSPLGRRQSPPLADDSSRQGSMPNHATPTGNPLVPVKRERSPTPPLLPMRHLITSGSKRYHPMPHDCQSTHPEYVMNRQNWKRKEIKALKAIGLEPKGCFIRADGMVIDWTTRTPVWSDTLKPDTPHQSDLANAIVRVHTANQLTNHKYADRRSQGKKKRRVGTEGENNELDKVRQGSSHDARPSSPGTITPSLVSPSLPPTSVALPMSPSASVERPNDPIPDHITQGGSPSVSPTPNRSDATNGAPQNPANFSAPKRDKTTRELNRLTAKARMRAKKRQWKAALAQAEAGEIVENHTLPPPPPPPPPAIKPTHPTPAASDDSMFRLPPIPSRGLQKAKAVDRPVDPLIPTHTAAENCSPNDSDFSFDRQLSGTPATTPPPTWSEIEDMENKALDYLERYIQVFDSDRLALANAYSRTAMFSYRIHNVVPTGTDIPSTLAESFAAPSGSRHSPGQCTPSGPVHRGRLEVMKALLSFGSQKFSEDVDYDVYWLGKEQGVLVVCHGEVECLEGTLHVEQTWVLKRKDIDVEDRATEDVWPIVAVSHQMVIRDLGRVR